jgi:NAD(P)-dependent dehydrogenase (short-subunit alcohol dehydrogenase family)
MAGVTLDLDDLQSERRFRPMEAYGRSKLALLMTGYALARRLAGAKVTVNALHPGLVSTSIVDDLAPMIVKPFLGVIKAFMLSPQEGAKPALHLVTAPELADVTGAYFLRMKQRRTAPSSDNLNLQEKLWRISARLVSLEGRL